MPLHRVVLSFFVLFTTLTSARAQSAPPVQQVAEPLRTFPMTGTLVDASGASRPGPATLIFALYGGPQDGPALWTETHTVQADERGRYAVSLGSATPLPPELFQTGSARWLGVRIAGGDELPRVRLVTVPYAMKAADADTLGGLPASAFLSPASGPRGVTRDAQAPGMPDQVVNDNLIVHGNLCAGVNCITGEVFEAAPLKVTDSTAASIVFEQNNGSSSGTLKLAGTNDSFGVADLQRSASQPFGNYLFYLSSKAIGPGIFMDQAGNIGLGTHTPAQKLDVLGTNSTYMRIRATQGGSAGLLLRDGIDQEAAIRVGGLTTGIPLVFEFPTGSEHLRITRDGNVGINTKNPSHALTITAASSSYVNLISLGGNAGHIFTAGSREAVIRENSADGSFVIENPNGTERVRVASNGNVGIGTTSPTNPLEMASGAFVSAGGVWTNASSRTFKDHVQELPIGAALDAFAKLVPVTFVYKRSPAEAHVGFIAEDVPDLVATADRKSLSAMDIVAILTKVMQAQQAEIADLKARLAKIEASERKR